ncbi:MAG: YciI family protein [Bryobacterales bacterium]|nr:YciI family protein [Bryobacterales bacterium]MBV9399069.1 YciI family protein [Bryobacterales bacterium]
MHYLLFYEVEAQYVERRKPFREKHLSLAREAYDRGELVLAGALEEPADQAVLVFSGSAPGAAEAFAKSDPYVQNGLVKSWRVRKWNTVVGDGAQPVQGTS